MAKDKKQKSEKERFPSKNPSIQTKEFTLKKSLNGKVVGDKIQVGPIGEKYYKQLNII
jgi:hypothetical protein